MPTTASQQQHQQAAELCRAAGQAWREEDGAHYQYSGYDTGEDNATQRGEVLERQHGLALAIKLNGFPNLPNNQI